MLTELSTLFIAATASIHAAPVSISVQDSPLMSKKRKPVRDHANGSLVWDYRVPDGTGIKDPAYHIESQGP